MKKLILSLSTCLILSIATGCDSNGTSNIAADADAEKLAAYEKALAEADAMTDGYEGGK